MRTGLSQRGWNNVLIFASLFMIVLFNSTHQRFVSNENNTVKRTLIDSNSLIQNIDYNGLRFERIGANWRTVSSITLDKELMPADIISHWTSTSIELLTNEPAINSSNTRLPISVDVLGTKQTLIFEFIIDNDLGLVYVFDHHLAQWMMIDQSQLPLFIPLVLLNITS